jgi:hypothetical protein
MAQRKGERGRDKHGKFAVRQRERVLQAFERGDWRDVLVLPDYVAAPCTPNQELEAERRFGTQLRTRIVTRVTFGEPL